MSTRSDPAGPTRVLVAEDEPPLAHLVAGFDRVDTARDRGHRGLAWGPRSPGLSPAHTAGRSWRRRGQGWGRVVTVELPAAPPG